MIKCSQIIDLFLNKKNRQVLLSIIIKMHTSDKIIHLSILYSYLPQLTCITTIHTKAFLTGRLYLPNFCALQLGAHLFVRTNTGSTLHSVARRLRLSDVTCRAHTITSTPTIRIYRNLYSKQCKIYANGKVLKLIFSNTGKLTR